MKNKLHVKGGAPLTYYTWNKYTLKEGEPYQWKRYTKEYTWNKYNLSEQTYTSYHYDRLTVNSTIHYTYIPKDRNTLNCVFYNHTADTAQNRPDRCKFSYTMIPYNDPSFIIAASINGSKVQDTDDGLCTMMLLTYAELQNMASNVPYIRANDPTTGIKYDFHTDYATNFSGGTWGRGESYNFRTLHTYLDDYLIDNEPGYFIEDSSYKYYWGPYNSEDCKIGDKLINMKVAWYDKKRFLVDTATGKIYHLTPHTTVQKTIMRNSEGLEIGFTFTFYHLVQMYLSSNNNSYTIPFGQTGAFDKVVGTGVYESPNSYMLAFTTSNTATNYNYYPETFSNGIPIGPVRYSVSDAINYNYFGMDDGGFNVATESHTVKVPYLNSHTTVTSTDYTAYPTNGINEADNKYYIMQTPQQYKWNAYGVDDLNFDVSQVEFISSSYANKSVATQISVMQLQESTLPSGIPSLAAITNNYGLTGVEEITPNFRDHDSPYDQEYGHFEPTRQVKFDSSITFRKFPLHQGIIDDLYNDSKIDETEYNSLSSWNRNYNVSTVLFSRSGKKITGPFVEYDHMEDRGTSSYGSIPNGKMVDNFPFIGGGLGIGFHYYNLGRPFTYAMKEQIQGGYKYIELTYNYGFNGKVHMMYMIHPQSYLYVGEDGYVYIKNATLLKWCSNDTVQTEYQNNNIYKAEYYKRSDTTGYNDYFMNINFPSYTYSSADFYFNNIPKTTSFQKSGFTRVPWEAVPTTDLLKVRTYNIEYNLRQIDFAEQKIATDDYITEFLDDCWFHYIDGEDRARKCYTTTNGYIYWNEISMNKIVYIHPGSGTVAFTCGAENSDAYPENGRIDVFTYIAQGADPDYNPMYSIEAGTIVDESRGAYPDAAYSTAFHEWIVYDRQLAFSYMPKDYLGTVKHTTQTRYPSNGKQLGNWYILTDTITSTEYDIEDDWLVDGVRFKCDYNSNVRDAIYFGGYNVAEIEFSLYNMDVLFDSFYHNGGSVPSIQYYIKTMDSDEWVPKGVFFPEVDTINMENTHKGTISAADKMKILLDKAETKMISIQGSQTLASALGEVSKNLLQRRPIYFGNELSTDLAGNFLYNGYWNLQTAEYTYNQVLMSILGINLLTMYSDEEGRIVVKRFTDIDTEFDKSDYCNYTRSPYRNYKLFGMSIAWIETNPTTTGEIQLNYRRVPASGNYYYYISSIPFKYNNLTLDDANTFGTSIWNYLKDGLNYAEGTLTFLNPIDVRPFDVIQVTDDDGTHDFMVHSIEWDNTGCKLECYGHTMYAGETIVPEENV